MAHTILVIPALLAALFVATGASAQTDGRPAVEVVVDNRAVFSAAELGAGQARARFIFDDAGIRLIFLTQGRDLAPARLGVDRVHLVLMDGAASSRLIAPDDRRLAFAIPPANRIYVHYDRVHALARSHRVGPGWFLGVVIAHELTHVLLPRAAHTHSGVMADALSPDPRVAPAFTPQEAQRLRARLGEASLLAQR